MLTQTNLIPTILLTIQLLSKSIDYLNDIVKKQKLATYIHKGFFFNIDKKIDLVKLKREKKQIIKNF